MAENETKTFPDLENHLFDAEQAADRLQLIKAKAKKRKAANLIKNIEMDFIKKFNCLNMNYFKVKEQNILEV